MKKYICRHCGHQSLIDPGERCPGCGYLHSFLKTHGEKSPHSLRRMAKETPIRQLACLIDGTRPAQCTITNKGLRIREEESGTESLIPYEAIGPVNRAQRWGCPLRYFSYSCGGKTIDLWFSVDRGILAKCPDIDEQVMHMTREFSREAHRESLG